MMKKRLTASLITGALLGIVCIIGVGIRTGKLAGNGLFLLAMWYNRIVMGLMIGLAGGWHLIEGPWNRYLRGGLLGLFVSLAIFLSTGLRDVPAFLA
ncbi:MAG: hypothetical protein ACLFV5_09390, partial [Anaerolineales bacterium]